MSRNLPIWLLNFYKTRLTCKKQVGLFKFYLVLSRRKKFFFYIDLPKVILEKIKIKNMTYRHMYLLQCIVEMLF